MRNWRSALMAIGFDRALGRGSNSQAAAAGKQG